MSSSGPGYLPYVSKIELICRLVRRRHSTPLLNTSITKRGEIHSGAASGRNGSAIGRRNSSAIAGRSQMRSGLTWWTFFRRARFRFADTPGDPPGSLKSPQTRLCRRHEQQSRAEPLNAEIRSGAEDGAEIETDRGRWMGSFSGRERILVALSCRTHGSWRYFARHLLSFRLHSAYPSLLSSIRQGSVIPFCVTSL